VTRTFRSRISPVILGIATAAAGIGLALGVPATAAQAGAGDAPSPGHSKVLPHETKQQPNFYFCGPSATRNALSALGANADVHQLAKELGTTEDGTNSAAEITRVLNHHTGKDRYRTVTLPDAKASAAQTATLKSDIVTTVGAGDPVVANVAGTITDTDGQSHSYEGGHYLAVVGYENQGDLATIADSADPDGNPDYKVKVGDLANWIASRGYSV
jgi:hypothetical protein